MSKRVIILIGAFLALSMPNITKAEDTDSQAIIRANLATRSLDMPLANEQEIKTPVDIKGWGHLYGLLIGQGIPPKQAHEILADPRMPAYEPLSFNIRPSESHSLYSKRNSPRERSQAMDFYRENVQWFKNAETTYQVPASIVLSLLQIETRCGKVLGKKPVFYHLARLATAGAKESIKESYSFNKRRYKDATLAAVKTRGEWLEGQFLPHVIATIRIANERGLSPHDILGSYGGAIGLPQFLPGHLYNYGVDANHDGIVDLNSPPDAILSVANYLNSNGWKTIDPPLSKRRVIIWTYNHSEPYVTTTIAMASLLDKQIKGKSTATAIPQSKSNTHKINKIKKSK